MLIRALLAFLALPGVVAFAAPLLIAWPRVREGSFNPLALVLLVPGIALLLWCVRDFFVTGKGTLAPWDPPRELVSSGPYRCSRNPMYVAVSLILFGWSIAFESWALLVYALIVMTAFHLRVVFGEEPWLARSTDANGTTTSRECLDGSFRAAESLLLSWLGLFALVLLAGLTYEAYADARAAREFPPPGMMVDIGGRRLHLVCIGRDDPMEPTVMFEASGWGNALSASKARERVATRTRVCSYDRLRTRMERCCARRDDDRGDGQRPWCPAGPREAGRALRPRCIIDRWSDGRDVCANVSGARRRHRLRRCGKQSVRPASGVTLWNDHRIGVHSRYARALRRDSPAGSVRARRPTRKARDDRRPSRTARGGGPRRVRWRADWTPLSESSSRRDRCRPSCLSSFFPRRARGKSCRHSPSGSSIPTRSEPKPRKRIKRSRSAHTAAGRKSLTART